MNRLRAFENRVLRIFGPTRDEETGWWRKLHNEELHDLYSSPSVIIMIKSRRMRWAAEVARMGEKRKAHRLLVRKPEVKRPLGRPRRRWVDNIRIDLGEVRWGDVDWFPIRMNLEVRITQAAGRTPGQQTIPLQGRYLHRTTMTQNSHASRGIRTHDPKTFLFYELFSYPP
jgi:hypothetical protein